MYELIWRNKFLTIEAQTIEDMINELEHALAYLREMKKEGVVLQGGAVDDYAVLLTNSKDVATKFGFELVENEED